MRWCSFELFDGDFSAVEGVGFIAADNEDGFVAAVDDDLFLPSAVWCAIKEEGAGGLLSSLLDLLHEDGAAAELFVCFDAASAAAREDVILINVLRWYWL